ncbi:MAG: hypothetical protein WBF17_05030, partial [Phycisphaerae bacterium]
ARPLRNTFATLFRKSGVVPRMARELMRPEPVEGRHPPDDLCSEASAKEEPVLRSLGEGA